MNEAHRYDVAISLLKEDEQWARRSLLPALCKHVRGEVFLYSRRQEEIASSGDLVTLFTRVFRDQARVCVVLLRDGWGQTQYTALEEDALKSRRLRDMGVRSIVLVGMDDNVQPPDWYPQGEFRWNVVQYNVSSIAALVAERVRDAGGVVGRESAADRAWRLQQAERAAADRKARLQAERGTQAPVEIAALLEHAERGVAELNERGGDQMRVEHQYPNTLVYYRTAHLLIRQHAHITPQLAAAISSVVNEGPVRMREETWRAEYTIGLDDADAWGWQTHSTEPVVTSSDLAEELLQRLVEAVHGSEQDGPTLRWLLI